VNKKIHICLVFALLVSTIAICVAQPPNLPGVSSTGVSSTGQPLEASGKLMAGEPPAIPTVYSAGAPPKEKSIQFAEGTSTGTLYPGALYNIGPGLVLESWDATSQTWTPDPIKQICPNNLWWYKITNPVKQNVWFDFGSGWTPNTPNPMLAGTYIRSLKLNPGWNCIIAWGSESSYSKPIWCYYYCQKKLTIQITNPGKPGPAPKTVTIKYNVNQDCTVRFMVNMPDGPSIDSGPMAVTNGNNIWTYADQGPTKASTGNNAGDREVVGFAWISDDSAADKQAYNVD